MPDKSTKHVPKKQWPVGMVRRGKLKVRDGATQKTSWRQGTTGFARDWDGDPIAVNYNKPGLKDRPRHHPHVKSKRRPRMPEE